MDEIARFVNKVRGINSVERWNFHPHLRRENVAEHSTWVAIFTAILADPIDRNALVFAAITHDFEEAITGDCPALIKAHVPGWSDVVLKAEGELFQAAVGPSEREIQDAFIDARHKAESSQVVKLADLFSALMYARMERELGNTHFARIERELIGSIAKSADRTTDTFVGVRAHVLLSALGFKHADVLDRPAELSHL